MRDLLYFLADSYSMVPENPEKQFTIIIASLITCIEWGNTNALQIRHKFDVRHYLSYFVMRYLREHSRIIILGANTTTEHTKHTLLSPVQGNAEVSNALLYSHLL